MISVFLLIVGIVTTTTVGNVLSLTDTGAICSITEE